MLCHGSRLSVVGGERLTPVRSTRYSERASSKQYDRRVSRSPVECAPILNMAFKAYTEHGLQRQCGGVASRHSQHPAVQETKMTCM